MPVQLQARKNIRGPFDLPSPTELGFFQNSPYKEPGWLLDRRKAALSLLVEATLPTTAEEVWRYSRIANLHLKNFRPQAALNGSAPPGLPMELRSVIAKLFDIHPPVPHAAELIMSDGLLLNQYLNPVLKDKGVVIGPLANHPEGEYIINQISNPSDVFGYLNRSYGAEPLIIDVPAGVTIEDPLVLIQWMETVQIATFPELIIRLGQDAKATVLDFEATADVNALSVPTVHILLADYACLDYLNIQQLGSKAWRLASHTAEIGKEATLVAEQIALGGFYARTRTDCKLIGKGATGNLIAGYFGEGNQMLDFRTFQEHIAPNTTSDLLYKGAVSGASRSVYTGLISVKPTAVGTNAFQTNRNIKLGPGAWAESVPNLEIQNNDVRCSHASTVGPVDDDQLFYLKSRGVPHKEAERLIVTGFFNEVLEKMPIPQLVGGIKNELAQRLQRS